MGQISQILMGASRRDAVTNMALRIESGLRKFAPTATYSFHLPDVTVEDDVRPLNDIGVGQPGDVLIYHASYGEPVLTKFLLGRPEKIVVVYHNITPSGYFIEVAPHFAVGLEWGRHELDLLSARAELAIGVSEYNAQELREVGYRDVRVVAAGVDPTRLADQPLDIDLMRSLEIEFPHGFVVFVSQLLPHKRPDLALGAVHLLRSMLGRNIGLVMAGPIRMTDYQTTVMRYAVALPDMRVKVLGEVTDSELATLYRMCLCYLNPSDHEGLAVPPLEAMACGAPVVVRDRGAMGATVGSGGVVLPAEWGPVEIAEALSVVVGDEAVRSHLRRRGYQRCAEFNPEESVATFVEMIRPLIS